MVGTVYVLFYPFANQLNNTACPGRSALNLIWTREHVTLRIAKFKHGYQILIIVFYLFPYRDTCVDVRMHHG